MTLNGTEYFYIRNGQGDITELIDTAGTQVVSYTYDSWGKLVSIDGSLKDTVGLKNPYRYRGYRYDTETSLYYLQSRYYNPEMGRYINADDVEFLGASGTSLGYNLFAYCENNPVNNVDPTGTSILSMALSILSWLPFSKGVSLLIGIAGYVLVLSTYLYQLYKLKNKRASRYQYKYWLANFIFDLAIATVVFIGAVTNYIAAKILIKSPLGRQSIKWVVFKLVFWMSNTYAAAYFPVDLVKTASDKNNWRAAFGF